MQFNAIAMFYRFFILSEMQIQNIWVERIKNPKLLG
jgi:hypothetical protein